MIRYISTRGMAPILSFEEVVLTGLASDGGLYVPDSLPKVDAETLRQWATLSYEELALEVMRPFVGAAIPEEALKEIIDASYAGFRHAAVAPLVQTGKNTFILELFHGPTLAFKDFALQFLGRVLDYFLTRRNQRVTIVGATSGDTGSAAIAGCRGSKHVDIFIMHPHGRVSEVQRRQMTTILDENVHNIALKGTFDDCQDAVKAMFADEAFRTKHHLVAVNSINFARILAQIVYYFYAALALGAPDKIVNFTVPTGNFGDIYAGYLAKRMGLPIGRLTIATNRNDILSRCLERGEYAMEGVEASLSPSMDIQISSNFERVLFDALGRDAAALRRWMEALRKEKRFALSVEALLTLRADFAAASADDEETLATIARIYEASGYVADPHTAVGIAAADKVDEARHAPQVILSTAHPAKFPDAVRDATGITPALPPHLADLWQKEERVDVLEADMVAIQSFIEARQEKVA